MSSNRFPEYAIKIAFLLHNRYAIGGVISSTLNLAGALADEHNIEIVSTRRDRKTPSIGLDARIKGVDLTDLRPTSHRYDGDDPLIKHPTLVFPRLDGARSSENNRLVEVRLAKYLACTDADVVIASHPGLAVCLAKLEGDFIRIAQMHQASYSYSAQLRKDLIEAYRNLDAVIPVSSEDAQNVAREFGHPGLRVKSIANCIPEPKVRPSDGQNNIVIAAGRLVPGKRYDDLLRAFALVVKERPDWELRIFGGGPERGALRDLAVELDLINHVHLMGPSDHLGSEWPKASIAVSASISEALPMNIIEAMSAGLPVVSTDCDFGPREIINHGSDGLLTPVEDVAALAKALLSLANDDVRRRRMGQSALHSSARFVPGAVARQYGSLITELAEQRRLPSAVDWHVMRNGDIAVNLVHTDPVRLKCVKRDGKAVRFDFQPAPHTGTQTALIPRAGVPLPEGMWDLHVESLDGRRSRKLHTGTGDSRSLLRLDTPCAEGPALQSRIPVTESDGSLSIRTWVRAVHAEAGDIRVVAEQMTFRAQMWGADLSPQTRVLVRSRMRSSDSFDVPVTLEGERDFQFRVPVSMPSARRSTAHDIWDVLVLPGPQLKPVRIGRFLGDYTHKKSVFDYPVTVIEETPRGRVRVRPFFTVHSELSINAVDIPNTPS